MQIEPIKYHHWSRAYRCSSGAAELVVVADIGPRILSLRWRESANLLYEDTTGLCVGAWRLYGGHRFTVAPEGSESYAPDNTPCDVEIYPDELCIAAEPGANGIQRMISISAAESGVGFDLHHLLKNHGPHPWHGALWAITCVPPSDVLAPRQRSNIRFWPGTKKRHWAVTADEITYQPGGNRGKIGWHSDAAWLASRQPCATLVVHDPDPPAANRCVDEGCNLEIFTCPDYLELETLGGETTLLPGAHALLPQRWRIFDPALTPGHRAISAAMACLSNPLTTHAA